MRCLLAASVFLALVPVTSARAQSLLAKPGVQQATVVGAQSAEHAKAGTALTLWADVTPNRSMHIYAEGAKDFTPVSLVPTPNPAVTAGRPTYPKPGTASSPGAAFAVPAYVRTFRITLPVTINPAARPGDVLTVAAAVNYQACDDRLCYPVAVAPVVWKVTVK